MKPLEEVDCFNYLGSQVAANEGCERDVVHRMNEGYRAWGALKNVLSNKGLGIKAKKCLYERTLSGRIGRVVASHAEGCKVACKIESLLWLSCTDLYYA